MSATRAPRAKKDRSRQVLGMAISMVGIGLLLLIISLALGSSPLHQAMSNGLRTAVPYAFLFGFALLILYAVLRPAPDTVSRKPKDQPTFFGNESTDFASRLDRETKEDPDPTVPVQHRGQRPPATTWSAQVFLDIEWRRFEAVCETLFAQAGFEARTQSHGADGGVDIWLYSRHAEGPAAIVQCKHWTGKGVGVSEMREFYGVMASHKLQRGTFATTSSFTADALWFAKDNGISTLDAQGLLALIATRTPAQQRSLLAVAYDGEYWRPTCASCGVKMVERTARSKGTKFWGCLHYPRCRFSLPVRAAA